MEVRTKILNEIEDIGHHAIIVNRRYLDDEQRAVPARNDIKVFNLSFGPEGPIEDDTISRFTYVLDTLAFTHKATFFVAVGNDGEKVGLDRIQAPSDLVHGVGVGAFTLSKAGTPVHAPYSSP